MPTVGNKNFDYTPVGKKKAAAFAAKTGKPMAKKAAPKRKKPAGKKGGY